MIKSSIVTAGYALIFLLCLPSSSLPSDSDYIELPFEFFHGRWVQGHSGEFKSTYVDYDSPDYFGSYNFIFGNNRLSILDIQKYILVNEKFESWRTANISFLKRVKPNWQIGIDQFRYDEYSKAWSSASELPFYAYSSNQNSLYVTASSKFSRNRRLKVSTSMETYSYFFEPILAKGELRFENLISVRQNNRIYYSIFFIDSISSGNTTIGNDVSYNWHFQNLLIWGVTDGLNFTAFFNSNNRKSTRTLYAESYRQGSVYSQSFGEIYSKEYRPWISLSVNSALVSNLYLKMNYQEWLRQRTYRRTGYSNIIGSNSFIRTSYESETELELYRSIWSANFRYINSGEFETGVLLDDYQNYYQGMLFRGQFALDLGIQLVSHGKGDAYRYVLNVSPTIGISNHVNIGAIVEYGFYRNRANFGSESVKSALTLKFRSYNYTGVSGSTWNGDDRYDQNFDRKLSSSQVYLEVRYFPPRLSSIYSENIVFFSFSKLRNSGTHNLTINAIVGVGKNFELIISGSENYNTKVLPTRRYDVGLSKRVLDYIDLSISYIQTSIGSNFSNPFARVSITALI